MKNTHFQWPTSKIIELDKQQKLLKLLISYSTNINKLDNFTHEQKIEILDGLPEIQQIINEFNSEKSISSETFNRYKYYLKIQLMNDFIENNITEYINTENIIMFFNQFNNSNEKINDYWMIKAQELSQIYTSDFQITIPDFSPSDIIFLLVNPIKKQKGFMFNEIEVPQQLFNGIYEISKQYTDLYEITIEIFKLVKKYVKCNYQKEFDQFLNTTVDFDDFLNQIQEQNILTNDLQNIFNKIQYAFQIGSKIPSKTNFKSLDFTDFEDLSFPDFNLYINKYPMKGFYIAQFPEIKIYLEDIYQIWKNNGCKREKYPLGLFEFRILSKFQKIQFQLPKNNTNNNLKKIQKTINKELELVLSNENINLCYFVGFLLPKVPSFITKSFYLEYIRDIVISLITTPKDITICQHIISFLKQFIPKILNKIGSQEWESIINTDLTQKTNDEFINFITNPWKFVLTKIDGEIRPGYLSQLNPAIDTYNKIKEKLNSFTTSDTIEDLNDCIIRDVSILKEQLNQDFKDTKNSIVNDGDVFRKWSLYSAQVSDFVATIPSLPTTSMMKYSPPILPGIDFDEFEEFVQQDLANLCNNEKIILALYPVLPNPKYVRGLQYIYNRKLVEIYIRIPGRCMLFTLPNNLDVNTLKLSSKSVNWKFLKIKFNDYCSGYPASMIGVKYTYEQFNEINTRFLQNSEKVDKCNRILSEIGNATIAFGKYSMKRFILRLEQLKNDLPDSINDLNELYSTINNVKKELKSLTNVTYSTTKKVKPNNTIGFLNDYLQDIDLSNNDFNPFTNLLKNYKLNPSTNTELDQLINNCKLFSLRPKNVKNIINEKIAKCELSNNSLIPSIYKDGNTLYSTAKSIEISCDSLNSGVNLLPLQIRFCNFTEEDLICRFEQTNQKLPLPTFKNDNGFLIIKVPIHSICENKYDSEKVINFNGTMFLNTKYNNNISAEIKYSITFNFDSSNLNDSNSIKIKINNNRVTNNANIVSFPIQITISSFYQKFNEILGSIYCLPSNIYELTNNNKNINEIQALLNPLITIYLWQNESSSCFPFSSLKEKFIKALSSSLNQLTKSGINLSVFRHLLIHNKTLYNNFVQLPELQFNEIEVLDDENDVDGINDHMNESETYNNIKHDEEQDDVDDDENDVFDDCDDDDDYDENDILDDLDDDFV